MIINGTEFWGTRVLNDLCPDIWFRLSEFFFISCTKKYAQSNKLFMMFKVYGNQQKEIRKIKEILKTKIDHSYSWNILYEGTKWARNTYLKHLSVKYWILLSTNLSESNCSPWNVSSSIHCRLFFDISTYFMEFWRISVIFQK